MGKITFKELPFTPKANWVIYIENDYDQEINHFLLGNTDLITDTIAQEGLEFHNIPSHIRLEAGIKIDNPTLIFNAQQTANGWEFYTYPLTLSSHRAAADVSDFFEQDDTEDIVKHLEEAVRKLRQLGMPLKTIHTMIDLYEPLSKVVINADNRIFLPDYNNIEIEMGALPKALYFLFLRYPEGLVFKQLIDHEKELLNIYKELRPSTDETTLQTSIQKIVDPFGNAINENVARIRKAFVEKFDERLAKNYIISGEKGGTYKIPLNRDMVIWEE